MLNNCIFTPWTSICSRYLSFLLSEGYVFFSFAYKIYMIAIILAWSRSLFCKLLAI